MKKILSWINGLKLRYKLILFYSCFCFLPVLVLFTFSFYQMRDIIGDKEQINLQSYLYQSVATMDSNMEVYDNLSDYIAFNQNLVKALEQEYESPYEQYVQLTEVVDPMLQSLKYFHTDITRETIYTDNGMVKHDTTIAPLSEIAGECWYQSVLLTQGIGWYVDTENEMVFSARTMPVDTGTGNPCILYIEVNYDKLFGPYEQTLTSEYGVFITDKAGQVIYSTSRFSEENSNYALDYGQFVEEKVRAASSEYTIISEQSSKRGWTVWLYQPKSIAGKAMRPIQKMVILTVLLCIGGTLLAYSAISSLISKRIEGLTARMLEVEEGNLEVEVISGDNDKDEIGLLYRGFGKMLRQIRTLINEVYVSKITQKESEMKALQAQINPHFLYNTLSLINWKALTAGEEDISKMTLAMSTFYRTALNKGKNTLRVEDELKNTQAYLEIQGMMHDHDFDYEVNVDPEIRDYESLNLILQPLVENAIMHGIEQKTDGRGRIVINGWMENDCVWFSVEDNGIGMEEEVAQRILTMESKGYGVRNVNERIQLFYGEEYAVTVESRVGVGTKMMLHFPARRTREG
ncbi:MAG: sensor histidine kinase [Lachnospiraceae bacterium]|nr:sensor histidine kinase [Lachnospiraceae bacterium]